MLSGQATGLPKSRDGIVESIRTVHVVKRSAMKARTQASSQMTNLIVTAPDTTRIELRGLTPLKRARRAAAWRPGTGHDPATVSAVNDGSYVPPDRQTVGEYMLEWLDSRKAQLRPSTWASYDRYIRLHVLPTSAPCASQS